MLAQYTKPVRATRTWISNMSIYVQNMYFELLELGE
jgi:hypothetical protein